MGFQPNKNAWVSPLSNFRPPSVEAWSMVQYELKNCLQHAAEALYCLPLIAIEVRPAAAPTEPVHQLRTGGLRAGG